MMKYVKCVLLGWSILLGFGSCEVETPKITFSERIVADSIYRERIGPLSIQLDSLCSRMQDSLIRVASDSLMQERLEEIARQLNRIRNENQ